MLDASVVIDRESLSIEALPTDSPISAVTFAERAAKPRLSGTPALRAERHHWLHLIADHFVGLDELTEVNTV